MIGQLIGVGKPASLPKGRMLRMFEYAAEHTDLDYSFKPKLGILLGAKEFEAAPRTARRMRHDRPRSRVRTRVSSLVPPVLKELRVRASRVHIECSNVGDHAVLTWHTPERFTRAKISGADPSGIVKRSSSTRKGENQRPNQTMMKMRKAIATA